ncbi:uncharacterized protein LOC141531531 isoform X2 [Cotesia typhae]|uniref:uncharacterized protein LOC141531531 isoform X2 n=1 Tax=Cotesia typhae TaxID=2053667 RepID=UPI003D681FFE
MCRRVSHTRDTTTNDVQTCHMITNAMVTRSDLDGIPDNILKLRVEIRSTKFYEQTLKDLLKYTRRGSKEIKENENKEEEEDEVEKNKEEEQERISSLRKRMENEHHKVKREQKNR